MVLQPGHLIAAQGGRSMLSALHASASRGLRSAVWTVMASDAGRFNHAWTGLLCASGRARRPSHCCPWVEAAWTEACGIHLTASSCDPVPSAVCTLHCPVVYNWVRWHNG